MLKTEDYFFFLVLRRAFLYLKLAFHFAESEPCVPLRKSENLIFFPFGSTASLFAFLKTIPCVIALLISLFITQISWFITKTYNSDKSSLIVFPNTGCLTNGATSTNGSITNNRLCIRGCGSIKRSVCMICSSTINRSISIIRS